MAVVTRFAPSPTGMLHVGGVRTALFSWLCAKHAGGKFILRVEDTDRERSTDEAVAVILEGMAWLSLDPDEGPYYQTKRFDRYKDVIRQMLAAGTAYHCYCTKQELDEMRQQQTARKEKPRYTGLCRDRREPRPGVDPVVRFRNPADGAVVVNDLVHGQVTFQNTELDDLIIARSDGTPTYNFCVVVDDMDMGITHVIRGDDHLSNTPKQVALYEALGWPVPEFAHLSTILGADRERLSKRHGATSIANFHDMGVLPEALVNYLALLGWAPTGGTREIFSMQELVKEFSLQRVTPSPAVFDMEKLYWLNRHYIKEKFTGHIDAVVIFGENWKLEASHPDQSQADRFRRLEERISDLPPAVRGALEAVPLFEGAGYLPAGSFLTWNIVVWLARVVQVFLPSVDRLDQLPERASLIFNYDAKAALTSSENAEVLGWPNTDAVLARFTFKILEDECAREGKLTPEQFKKIVNEIKAETGAKGKELFHPIRIVVTGSHSGPEFDKLIPILEEGSRLPLPKPVLNVHQRVSQFAKVRAK
jgi:nondiscriminating glutamyl-tRNA synthetase